MQEFKDFFKNRKNLIATLVLGILILALPLGIRLLQRQQIIQSRADIEPLSFVAGPDVKQKADGTWVTTNPRISLRITSPLGPPTGSTAGSNDNTNQDNNNNNTGTDQTGTSQPSSPAPPIPSFSVGVNTTGIIHYGYNDLLPYSSSGDVDAALSEISRMKGRIVRVFVANDQISSDEAAKRLDSFLTKAEAKNISVIPSLINFYGDNGFRPQGTQQYYTDQWNSISLLGHDFFASGYKNEYLSFVRTVVSRNKNHANIYAWEPGNELKDSNNPQTFISFMKDVSRVIKETDPAHPVATGMINAGHTALTPQQLYSALPDVDIITIHNYGGDHSGTADAAWALANGKKVIVGEIGFPGTGDRSTIAREEMNFWKDKGVSAVLHWGFLPKNLSDNGDGDKVYGMDNIWHTDYDQLFSLYSSFN